MSQTPEFNADTDGTAPESMPSGPLAREALALAAFDHVVSHASGFRVFLYK
jgi:ATP-dependent DNA helicase DinG